MSLMTVVDFGHICGRLLDDCYQRAIHCKRVAATAAAVPAAASAVVVVGVAVVVACKWITRCKVFPLHCLVCLSPFLLHHVFPSASSARLRVSSTLSSSRACSAALLAARQIRRRPRAVLHVWSAVHTDPRVLPPCHVSLRHITFFVH